MQAKNASNSLQGAKKLGLEEFISVLSTDTLHLVVKEINVYIKDLTQERMHPDNQGAEAQRALDELTDQVTLWIEVIQEEVSRRLGDDAPFDANHQVVIPLAKITKVEWAL